MEVLNFELVPVTADGQRQAACEHTQAALVILPGAPEVASQRPDPQADWHCVIRHVWNCERKSRKERCHAYLQGIHVRGRTLSCPHAPEGPPERPYTRAFVPGARERGWRTGSRKPACSFTFDDLENALEDMRVTLDHNFLNNIDGLDNPTLELITKWMWDRLHNLGCPDWPRSPSPVTPAAKGVSIRVQEQPRNG